MTERYPDEPGAKGLTGTTFGTSADAAAAISGNVSHLRCLALATVVSGEATVLELIARTDCTRESLRPRFSELIALGLIEPTGERRRNASGKSAAVLRITERGLSWCQGGGK